MIGAWIATIGFVVCGTALVALVLYLVAEDDDRWWR